MHAALHDKGAGRKHVHAEQYVEIRIRVVKLATLYDLH
jgi:hypothetical protein